MVKPAEIWRKIVHVLLGVVLICGSWWIVQRFGTTTLEWALLGVALALITCDVLVADYRLKLPLYAQLGRQHEKHCFHTATLAVLSGLVAYKLFVLPVALAAISMFAFGDAAAALVGMKWGKREFGTKSIAGTGAMFVVSAVIGWMILGWVGIAMAVIATIAECIVTKINDAITIPLFAGAAGQLLLKFFL